MSLFRLSPHNLIKKKWQDKIIGLTAYDYISAKIAQESKVDFILIGDSASMIMLGYPDTYPITLEEMLIFCQAVARGAPETLRIGDMPFLSYQVSIEKAIYNAGLMLKKGRCHGVKIEGGSEVIPVISALVKAGIPVMAHLGLTPQRSLELGGLRVQGKDLESAEAILTSALALEEAGAFAIVLECIPAPLAKLITEKVKIPTIGIGAGPYTDGQILVFHDVVGLFSELRPKFVKNYLKGYELFKSAIDSFIEEVKTGKFPEVQHQYSMEEKIIEELKKKYD
ncbi:MAG: 3-methyl-2-oxobutanoate hydroxymethyltransferase [Caldimicrobium sp.]|nr:3-methyl-2-oxobutanoate hydroxymethyltransferase [Caldimicrobium sp.]MCX7874362.1 3-methyl-2-oxobutanoate hydroxymethyltransferase [Caldimicrobium sp.]MDW8093488.1 3-methyl-2-oxobutanoate hydroxymethyltransferase [Caldimicrobium sp.]